MKATSLIAVLSSVWLQAQSTTPPATPKFEVVSVKPCKPGEIKPMGLALSPDASKLYVSAGRGRMVFVVDTATNKPIGSFDVGQRPRGIALASDGKTLVTANGPSNDVSIVDLGTQTVTKKIKAGGGPWGVVILQ